MSAPDHVVIVGASAAGVTVADTLRDEGFHGRVTLLGSEPGLPYDRPPLSKEVLAGTRDTSDIALRQPGHYEGRGIDLRAGRSAVRTDAGAREVVLDTGETLGYDALVATTGVAPRRLPVRRQIRGVHVLRTLADLEALRTELPMSRRVLVVGAGFLGMEVAATCRSLGAGVTVVSPRSTPLFGQLGPLVGGQVAALHAEHGVELRTGVGVTDMTDSDGRLTGAVLTDRSVVTADTALVAIGSEPQTAWLSGSGLDSRDGVGCDAYCSAAPGMYAAGDVARWHHRKLGTHVRVEHRMNAAEQGMCVARNILGAAQAFSPTPYAWSDQYDARIQTYGFTGPRHDVTIIEGSLEERRFVALYGRHGRVTGALAWRCPKGLRRARELVVQNAPWDEARSDPHQTADRQTAAPRAATTTSATTPTPAGM